MSRLEDRGTIWYLATIEDVATRQVIAKRIGKRHDSHLVLATLQHALATGHQPQIFHSDQGTEFMAQRCTDYLEQRAVLVSVSDIAAPWQNGYIESFYGRLKHEIGDLNRFESPGEMIEAVYCHIHCLQVILRVGNALYAERSRRQHRTVGGRVDGRVERWRCCR